MSQVYLNMTVTNSIFSHKRIHKGTWKAPGSNIIKMPEDIHQFSGHPL